MDVGELEKESLNGCVMIALTCFFSQINLICDFNLQRLASIGMDLAEGAIAEGCSLLQSLGWVITGLGRPEHRQARDAVHAKGEGS
jgi:hypothetical protein